MMSRAITRQSTALSRIDSYIVLFDQTLRSLVGKQNQTYQENPALHTVEATLNAGEKQHVIGLMRVNHAGEISAQALYQGQALTTRDKKLNKKLKQAAQEEIDHLAWCKERLEELEGKTSFLNPLWYFGSLLIGIAAGLAGDRWSLGFLAETENQVQKHLGEHLDRLPKHDQKSKVILETMRADEIQHAITAMESGACQLPGVIKYSMRCLAKIMTKTAYYV